jgi:hypothetical protein
MRLRIILAALAAPLLITGALLAGATGTVSADPTGSGNSAAIVRGFGCSLTDGNGNFVFTTATLSVITSSGNALTKCQADVTPSSGGTAVITSGFPCFVNGGYTTKTHETVSASGQATLICQDNGAGS